MNWLFICSKNRWRSLTAENIFKDLPSHSVRSAGTDDDARIKVNLKLIQWADQIFVMEKKHQELLRLKFPAEIMKKQIIILNIPDEYRYGDAELIEILKESVGGYV